MGKPEPFRESHHQPSLVSTGTVPALTDLETIDLRTDQGPWLEWLHDTAQGQRHITVMHMADIHFPFHNHAALELSFHLVSKAQPDVIVVGSDIADFALLGKFDIDPDIAEDTTDVLEELQGHYNPFIQRLRSTAPRAIIVWIWGNHDRRIITFLGNHAPKLRKTVERDFIAMIRAGGAVQYLGYRDDVRMGPLVVQHGNRHNKYTAQSLLDDIGYQVSTMAGHVHRLTYAEKRGEDFTVEAITSGCLCNYPHYMKGRRMTQKWKLGTAIATLDLRGRDVQFTNLMFQKDAARLWTRYQGEQLDAPLAQERDEHIVTFEEYLAQK